MTALTGELHARAAKEHRLLCTIAYYLVSYGARTCACWVASYPGPAQLSVTCSTEKRGTNSDGKLGGAWVRGYLLGKLRW